MLNTMTIQEALEAVVKESKNVYAKIYAQAALELGDSRNAVVVSTDIAIGIAHEKTGKMMVGKELKVQIAYILSNLQSWRGERAREVKAVLKEAIK